MDGIRTEAFDTYGGRCVRRDWISIETPQPPMQKCKSRPLFFDNRMQGPKRHQKGQIQWLTRLRARWDESRHSRFMYNYN